MEASFCIELTLHELGFCTCVRSELHKMQYGLLYMADKKGLITKADFVHAGTKCWIWTYYEAGNSLRPSLTTRGVCHACGVLHVHVEFGTVDA